VGDIKCNADRIAGLVREKGYHNVYAHIDLDVLYPEKHPWVQCPSENGLDMPELMRALRSLNTGLNLAGISVLELRPVQHMDVSPLRELVSFCLKI
jgi:arginase